MHIMDVVPKREKSLLASFGMILGLMLAAPLYGQPVQCEFAGGGYFVIVDTQNPGALDLPPDVPDPLTNPDPIGDSYFTATFQTLPDGTELFEVASHGIEPRLQPQGFFLPGADFSPYCGEGTCYYDRYDYAFSYLFTLNLQNGDLVFQQSSCHSSECDDPLLGIVASKTEGAPDYNRFDFSWVDASGSPTTDGELRSASGVLEDLDGDGEYDNIGVSVTFTELPGFLDGIWDSIVLNTDVPLAQFFNVHSGYLCIPNSIDIGLGASIPAPKFRLLDGGGRDQYTVCFPVDTQNRRLSVTCGGRTFGPVTLNAPAPPPPQPDENVIPTLSEWGFIFFFLLMLGLGIWMMRKGGFDDTLSGR